MGGELWWQKADIWASLVLGALIAVPISILANILTPSVSNFISKYSLKRREKTVNDIVQEIELIKGFVARPDLANLYFIKSFIQITILLSLPQLVGILLVPLILIRQFHYIELFTSFSQVMNAVFVMIALNVAFRALSVYRKIADFREFERSANERVSKLMIGKT